MFEEFMQKATDIQEMTKTLVTEGLLFPMLQPEGDVVWIVAFAGGEESVGNKGEDVTFTWDDLLEIYKKQRT